ncbi:uncharacterized protein CLUP02_02188 [Colletotrichum lupini]|uniref:Uncharacterized protein n=1 Tax=Colletotrichum lupini TaxID=145971 RepID=A0A9Q8W9V6_9PEZI|nr:uncharacterized protein CLUP02_02188 [Colletotrichum lupini]UQC75534.1 hypothetical protein CLUP02_02188 [Colletotrichum lupini]
MSVQLAPLRNIRQKQMEQTEQAHNDKIQIPSSDRRTLDLKGNSSSETGGVRPPVTAMSFRELPPPRPVQVETKSARLALALDRQQYLSCREAPIALSRSLLSYLDASGHSGMQQPALWFDRTLSLAQWPRTGLSGRINIRQLGRRDGFWDWLTPSGRGTGRLACLSGGEAVTKTASPPCPYSFPSLHANGEWLLSAKEIEVLFRSLYPGMYGYKATWDDALPYSIRPKREEKQQQDTRLRENSDAKNQGHCRCQTEQGGDSRKCEAPRRNHGRNRPATATEMKKR